MDNDFGIINKTDLYWYFVIPFNRDLLYRYGESMAAETL